MSHLESGSVVWVRLGQAWWPGTITTVAKCPPEFVEGIRKIPIAIVKFFHENEFQDVHKSEHICPYNCDRKEEFIRRGQYTNKNQSHGEVDLLAKFEADVVTAEKLTGGDMNILQTLDEVADACSPSYNIQSSPTNPHLELDYTLMSHKLVASSDSLCSTCVANDDYLSRPQRNLWPEPGEGVSEGHKARTQGDSDSCKVRSPHSNDKDQSSYKKTFDQITSQLNEKKMAFFNDHILGAPNAEISELEFKNRQTDSQLKSPRQDYNYCYVDDKGDIINVHVSQKNYAKENQEKDNNDLKQYIVDKENLNDVDIYSNSENSVHYDTVKDLNVNISGSKQKQKQTFRNDSDKTNIHGNTLERGHIHDIDREVGQVDNDEQCSNKAQKQELCHTTEVKEGKTLHEGDTGREVKDQEQSHNTKEENMCFMITNQQKSQCDKPFQAHLADPEPQTDNHLKGNKYMGKKFLSDVHVLDHPSMNTDGHGHSYRISEEQNCRQTQKKNGLLHRGHGSATQEEQHNSSQEHSQSQTHKPSVTNTTSQPEECHGEQHATVYTANVEINMLTESNNSKHIVQDLHKSVNDGQPTHCYPADGDHTGELSDTSSHIFSDETSHFVDEVHNELIIENSLKTTSLIPRQCTDSKDLSRIPADPTFSSSEGSSVLFRNLNSPHSSHTIVNAPSGSATSTKETNSTNADDDVADFEGFEAENNRNINALTQILINIINNKKEYREKISMKKAREKKTKSPVGKARGAKRTKVKEEKVGRKTTNIPVLKAERKKPKGAKRRVGRKNSKCAVVNDSVMDKKPSFVEKKSDSRRVKNIKSTRSTVQIGYAKVKRVKCELDSNKLPENNTKKRISSDRQTYIKTKSSRKVKTDRRESGSLRQSERKRKSSEMDNLLNRENKIKRTKISASYESDKSKERMQKKQFRVRKPGMQPKKNVTRRKGKSRNRKADIHGSGTRKKGRSQTKQKYSRLETEEDLPDLTVAPLTKGKPGSSFKTGDLVWSLYGDKWWPSFIQKIFPITKKASVFFIGCKEGNGIRVDMKNVKTFRSGDVPSDVNQSENGFTEALQLTESYCQLRDHGKSISVQEFFSMPPEEQDALIIVSLTPKEDPNLSTQSMKRKLEEDMKWERTPESHKNWYYEPVKGSSHGESSPIANQELPLSARDRMKIQSAMKARRKENERLLKFMKSASCMNHLWQIFNGEKSCERHNTYQDEITRRTLLWSGIGPFQLDQDDDQILSVIDFLSTELSRKRPQFRLAHDYTFRVWMPEAIKEALRVIRKVPEDELELALDEGYRETKTEKRARHLDFT